MPAVYAIATMDTKGEEIAYVARRLRAAGVEQVVMVDVGTDAEPAVRPDVTRQQVAAHHPQGPAACQGHTDRGQAVSAISEALVPFMLAEHAAGKVAGVIGVGGSGGTALISPALQALPIGLPKMMVSTVASGNTAPYVGCCDITMMYSVVDVAGLNRVSRQVLGNAAHALAGMVRNTLLSAPDDRPAVGMTMFGVTTPCVTAVRQALEAKGYDGLVFHATGTGGQAMEKLVESGLINAVMDITTTEVADEVVGGVFRAGPQRFDVIAQKRIPCVMSLGALDMVNFGAKDTVPPAFRERKLHAHNANVTLMRTTPEENRKFVEWMAPKINRTTAPFVLLIPEGGVSMLDAPGMPFHDPEADKALFDTLEKLVQQTPTRRLVRLPLHINDPKFAEALVNEFLTILRAEKQTTPRGMP